MQKSESASKLSLQQHLKVFLCHASEDKPLVRKLHRRLSRLSNLDLWLDDIDLMPGQNWDQEIKSAIRRSNVVIVCLSRNSVAKEGYVQKEILEILEVAKEKPFGTVFLLPARLDNCQVPPHLRAYQHANVFEKNGYAKLIDALQLRAEMLGIPIDGSTIPEPHPAQPEVVSETPQSDVGSLCKQFLGEVLLISSIPDPSARMQAASDAAMSFQKQIPHNNLYEETLHEITNRMKHTRHLRLSEHEILVLSSMPQSYLPDVLIVLNGSVVLNVGAFLMAFDKALKAGCNTPQLLRTMDTCY